MMARALVVGHSHTNAIRIAAEAGAVDWLKFYSLAEKRPTPWITPEGELGESTVLELATTATGDIDAVFLSIHGNNHNVFAIANHPVPYDFVLREDPDLEVVKRAELIPYSVVYEAMFAVIQPLILGPVAAFRQHYRQPVFFLEPPPPIPSADHIMKYPGILREALFERGVSPAIHRYKVWKLQNRIIKDGCDACGVGFLPVPAAALDEKGFLKQEMWSQDPTHGNPGYGALVLESIKGAF